MFDIHDGSKLDSKSLFAESSNKSLLFMISNRLDALKKLLHQLSERASSDTD